MKTKMLRAWVVASLLVGLSCQSFAGGGQWTVVAWNNLGMHCMDDDYSVFSILPPFNTINAQVMDAAGHLITDPAAAGITVTYQSVANPDGSINTTSLGKTNFYDFAVALYGANVAVDAGLAGKAMPGGSNTPQTMNWVAGMNWFEAAGIPICPTDDAGHKNPYPLMRVSVKNALNTVLASADIVVPVSDEMDCRACHKSGTGSAAAMPAAGWVNDANDKRDFRLNILRLHDEKNAANPLYAAALAAMGYPSQGLYHSVVNTNKQVLCAHCHASEALGTGGAAGVPPLTAAARQHREPQFLLHVPSRQRDPLPARCDGQRGEPGRWLARDAMPELPRQHGRRRCLHAHRLAARAELPGLPQRRRARERRANPLHQRLHLRHHDARAGEPALCHECKHARCWHLAVSFFQRPWRPRLQCLPRLDTRGVSVAASR